jgi:hypothetical protein
VVIYDFIPKLFFVSHSPAASLVLPRFICLLLCLEDPKALYFSPVNNVMSLLFLESRGLVKSFGGDSGLIVLLITSPPTHRVFGDIKGDL